ncbi:MAG: hypothetical protein BroJett018_31610 [Chloroflexota bacterium]|nr:hypothetical protein [Chloroflexota bacterium]NOG66271.1 hypothetical protein [Chloroflexota bacterium]GIK65367.1 MAG: hypothetical protein BroJett018_31610 [Chloroflexota bacterium]
MNGLSIIFLVVFFASLVGGYVAIRRNLSTIMNVGLISGAINVSSLTIVGLGRDADTALSVIGGIVVGIGLTVAMITMAAFFQNNQSSTTIAAFDAASKEKSNPQQ